MPNHTPKWMKPVDRRILEMLEQSKAAKLGGLWLKSATLAVNLDNNNDYINQRLRELERRGLVESGRKGYYRITDEGSALINQ